MATAVSNSRIMGANDRVQVGLIGAGERGRYDTGNFVKTGKADVAAVCDIYGVNIDHAKQEWPNAKSFTDHRQLLETKTLDVAVIGVPDHWHAAIAIDALNAGKDVYVEKPLTLKLEEGPQIVKAARVNNRICQVGMQQRSGKHYIEAKQQYIDAGKDVYVEKPLTLTPEQGPPIVKAARVNNRICQVGMQQRSGIHYLRAKQEYFDSGKIGKVTLARTWWHGNTYHLRRAPASLQSLPSNLDWAHFLGPLKWRDYDPQQYFNWRAYLDFGGGQVTDLFTHWIDVVHLFMGQDTPFAASAAGGVYNYKDGRTAPDTINVLLQYPGEFTATFEATLAPGITGAAVEMCGTEGRLYIDRGRYDWYAKGARTPETVKAEPHDMTLDHVNNFLECVKTRKTPHGDVLIGHRSAQASHLGNISYMQKRRIDFDPLREEILPF